MEIKGNITILVAILTVASMLLPFRTDGQQRKSSAEKENIRTIEIDELVVRGGKSGTETGGTLQ